MITRDLSFTKIGDLHLHCEFGGYVSHLIHNFALVAQLVVHRPSKSGVAGSSPVYRSINRSLTF